MELEPNCVGFVLYQLGLGINGQDQYVHLQGYEELIDPWFEEVGSFTEAEVLAVIDVKPPRYVLHMAVTTDDHYEIIHRPGRGEEVVRESLAKALAFYSNGIRDGRLRVAKLRVKDKLSE